MKAVVRELVAARCISGRRIVQKPLSRFYRVLLSFGHIVFTYHNIYIFTAIFDSQIITQFMC